MMEGTRESTSITQENSFNEIWCCFGSRILWELGGKMRKEGVSSGERHLA